jgi:cytochrome c oxidase subunit 1
MAAFYFWFPKATGLLLREGLGKAHFWLWLVGTNVTFGPMFFLGLHGMPRRVPTYLPSDGLTDANLVATIGSGVLGLGTVVFLTNVLNAFCAHRPAPPDPWRGHTLEWATSSPPPPTNFTAEYPIPPVRSFAPLLDARERRERRRAESAPRAGRGRW